MIYETWKYDHFFVTMYGSRIPRLGGTKNTFQKSRSAKYFICNTFNLCGSRRAIAAFINDIIVILTNSSIHVTWDM